MRYKKMEVKQLNSENYSEDRKKALSELEKEKIVMKEIERIKNTSIKKEKIKTGIEHINKKVKGDHIYIKCIKCNNYKLSTNYYWKRVEQFGSEEKLCAGYICRSCKKNV